MNDDKICCICTSGKNVQMFHIYKGNPSFETHFDGDVYVCQECLDSIEKCPECKGYLRPAELIELRDWHVCGFCNCEIERHDKTRNKQKKEIERKRREERILKAKKEENIIQSAIGEHISDYIVTVGCERYILDCCCASAFGLTTNQLRIKIKQNINMFKNDEVYRFSDKDLKYLEENISDYNSSITPYGLNVCAIIKLSVLFGDTNEYILFDGFTNCYIENSNIIKNKKVRNLYDKLFVDTYEFKSKKQEIERNKTAIAQNQILINDLNSEIKNLENKNAIKSFFIMLLICVLIFFIHLHFF